LRKEEQVQGWRKDAVSTDQRISSDQRLVSDTAYFEGLEFFAAIRLTQILQVRWLMTKNSGLTSKKSR
jgi:hypothetical protein